MFHIPAPITNDTVYNDVVWTAETHQVLTSTKQDLGAVGAQTGGQ